MGEKAQGAPSQQSIDNLCGAIRIRTVSHEDKSKVDESQFEAFVDFLSETYPLVHEKLKREVISDYSLFYTWEGSDPGMKPALLTAHMDVVPIAEGTLDDWTQPPFDGVVADGYIWGRGTMDCKVFLIGILEAAEELLSKGYSPVRTICFGFGQDEEVGGWSGAKTIAETLKERGMEFEYVLDEGGFLLEAGEIGIKKALATVGIAEKGYLALELKTETEGGHSSMPPRTTAIGIIARAINRLERHPFPSRIETTTQRMIENLKPELPLPLNLIAGSKMMRGLMKLAFKMNTATNAMIHTTVASTIMEAGSKENVLPQEARAVINIRLLPGDSSDYAVARVKKIIRDKRIKVSVLGNRSEASIVSRLDSKGYGIVRGTIEEVFAGSVIVPLMTVGMSDARHYTIVCDSVYRFCPLRIRKEDQSRVHGTDERIGVGNFAEVISFYRKVIENSN